MRPVLIPLVAILTVGCARRTSVDTPTPVECPAATVPTVDWREATIRPGFSMRLPPGFVRESKLYCEHGGEYYVRGRDRLGWCNGMFESSTRASSPGEEPFSLFGRAALIACVRRDRGWSAYIRPIELDGWSIVASIEASDRATLADALGSLKSAKPVRP